MAVRAAVPTVGPWINLSLQGSGGSVTVTGTAPSSSRADTWVQVTYTVSGQSATASIRFCVRDVRSLQTYMRGGPGTVGTEPVTIGSESGYITYITYFIYDQFQDDVALFNIPATEILSTTKQLQRRIRSTRRYSTHGRVQ